MNDFVSYLNSTNNVGGNSTGSLAESQVKSPFFNKVKVDRKLGSLISDSVKNGAHQAYILTGHAGDGKTSILVQVLEELGYILPGEGLDKEKEFSDFYYVKDMSEVAEAHQEATLKKALDAPVLGKTSLLISNTGPLINAFISLVSAEIQQSGEQLSEDARIELQSTLLTQLDTNEDREITIRNHRFVLINIARVDNVCFATSILKKILDEQLWSPCEGCSCKDRCPIKYNRDTVNRQFDRVSLFVESYYRYLYENDRRMTIRQMVGQLGYALTGNLSCAEIETKYLKEPFFNYNFANLFFGYSGLSKKKDASQIKGIEQIQFLELDQIALDVDYTIFVNQNYSAFYQDIQELLIKLRTKYRKHYQINDEEDLDASYEKKTENLLRRAIRRFYLMYSLENDDYSIEGLLNQVFGANYCDYANLICKKQPKHVLRKLQSMVFQALYMKNTGALPDSQNELPLTLRREDDVFQNVMLVLGEVNKSDLEIVQVPVTSRFEDTPDKQSLYLRLQDDDFRLTLPMISYFQNLIDGAIASNTNPALTHGIATLDALLLEKYGDETPLTEEDCEMRVIINTTSGQDYETFSFSNGQLDIL